MIDQNKKAYPAECMILVLVVLYLVELCYIPLAPHSSIFFGLEKCIHKADKLICQKGLGCAIDI